MVTARILPLALGICLLVPAGADAAEKKKEPEKFRPIAKDMSDRPVTPAPTGNLRFIGNKSYNEEQLREPLATSLQEIAESGLTKPRADDAAYFLSVFYRKQGYTQADVRWDIRGSVLVLTIKEGPRTYLNRIVFQGNQSQTSETLYEYMIGETGERLLRQPEKFPFVEADMQTGVARVRGLYESEGRLDVQVEDAEFKYSRDRTSVDVFVKITEGPKYEFGTVTIDGNSVFSRERIIAALGNPTEEKVEEKPEEARKSPLEEPFTPQRANTLQQDLLYFYKLQGYYAAAVSVTADPQKAVSVGGGVRKVPVVLQVKPGKLHYFDGVNVTGLTRLRPSFLQKRFGSLHGQKYNPQVLDKRYREVLRTGLFRTLRLATTPVEGDEVRMDLTVEEAKAKEVGFSVGFSSYEGAMLGLRLSDRNFMANGRPLSLDIDYSTRAMRGELLYVDPWWHDTEFGLRARLFVQTRTEVGYTKQDAGLRLDLTRQLTDRIATGTFLQLKNVNVTESEIEPEFLGLTSYQVATVGITQTFDYRNNPVNPTKGWIMALGTDAGTIAGELAFGRTTARLSYYLPIQKRYLLALGARAGVIYPFTAVPIDERFFNGGGTTVRSFRDRRLGPKDKHGYPIGGEAFTTFNAEFVIPIKDALAGAVFVDAGNVSSRLQDAGFGDMRYAIGLGLRYQLPIGPVRLDVGVNPSPKQGDPWGAVHFSFGFAF